MQDLQKLFLTELADIYDAEKQLVNALPKLAKAAQADQLRSAFEEHLGQTEQHVERLESIFSLFSTRPKAKKCQAMDGIVEEGEKVVKEFKSTAALDAALIGAAQKSEHYEMASYGCLCSWAEELGNQEAVNLLKETLAEEKTADHKLTELAEARANPVAA